MKPVSIFGIVVAAIALILALVAIVTAPEGAGAVKGKVAIVEQDLAQMKNDIASLRTDLENVKPAPAELPADVQALVSRAAGMSDRVAKLERSVAELAGMRTAEAAPVKIDQAKIQEAIRAYFTERMRARGGQPAAGGRPQPGGQPQRGGPPRVANNEVPQAARDAAAKAVPGFKLDHVHPGEKTPDGKATYTVDGSANGKSFRIKVTADGKFLGKEERTGRGRGRRPPRGGGGAGGQTRPAGEPERF